MFVIYVSALYVQDSSRGLEENLQFVAMDSQTGQSKMSGPGIDVIFLFDVSKSVRSGRPPLYVKAVNFAKAYVQKV